MAKSKKKPIVESIVTTTTIKLTGILNLDELKGFGMEFEDQGEVDVTEKLKKYNGKFGTISFSEKDEEIIEG